MAAEEGDHGGLQNIWQAIGKLEANVARLLDGQSDLRTDLREGQSELRTELRDGQSELRTELRDGQSELRTELRDGLKTTNARIDKLLWLGLGLAGGVVTLLVLEVLSRTSGN